jgi:hypothetical protein
MYKKTFKKGIEPVITTHVYNPSYSEGRDWEDCVPGQPRKNVQENPS